MIEPSAPPELSIPVLLGVVVFVFLMFLLIPVASALILRFLGKRMGLAPDGFRFAMNPGLYGLVGMLLPFLGLLIALPIAGKDSSILSYMMPISLSAIVLYAVSLIGATVYFYKGSVGTRVAVGAVAYLAMLAYGILFLGGPFIALFRIKLW